MTILEKLQNSLLIEVDEGYDAYTLLMENGWEMRDNVKKPIYSILWFRDDISIGDFIMEVKYTCNSLIDCLEWLENEWYKDMENEWYDITYVNAKIKNEIKELIKKK